MVVSGRERGRNQAFSFIKERKFGFFLKEGQIKGLGREQVMPGYRNILEEMPLFVNTFPSANRSGRGG